MLLRIFVHPCRQLRVHLRHTPWSFLQARAQRVFADALKRVIREMDHERLRVMSPTDFIGVGYVYNAADPETWPIRSSY